uniref:Uncharacterized protein n=1 Tax=Arundo donax TaxID=35708 RepID=A0A0A9G0X9_ARUDO
MVSPSYLGIRQNQPYVSVH